MPCSVSHARSGAKSALTCAPKSPVGAASESAAANSGACIRGRALSAEPMVSRTTTA
jgi:hypothetical protein